MAKAEPPYTDQTASDSLGCLRGIPGHSCAPVGAAIVGSGRQYPTQPVYAPQPPGFLAPAQDRVFNASETTSREIDLAVPDLLESGGKVARAILEKRRADLEAGAKLLLTKETLTAEEFSAFKPAAQLQSCHEV